LFIVTVSVIVLEQDEDINIAINKKKINDFIDLINFF